MACANCASTKGPFKLRPSMYRLGVQVEVCERLCMRVPSLVGSIPGYPARQGGTGVAEVAPPALSPEDAAWREQVAIQAMNGIFCGSSRNAPDFIVDMAWQVADLMLKRRRQ